MDMTDGRAYVKSYLGWMYGPVDGMKSRWFLKLYPATQSPFPTNSDCLQVTDHVVRTKIFEHLKYGRVRVHVLSNVLRKS